MKPERTPPGTPRHSGRAERGRRNGQKYFYGRETRGNIDELNKKLQKHLERSNSKPMRTPDSLRKVKPALPIEVVLPPIEAGEIFSNIIIWLVKK